MDADGYFTIKRGTYGIRKLHTSKNPTYTERVGIKQVQPQAIKLIYQNFGGYYHIEKPSAKNGKSLHSLQLGNQKAHTFIKTIYPFLRLKKRQAKILLQLRESLKEGKEAKGEWGTQKSRWGTMMRTRKARVSERQIIHRENFIKQIKKLNDSRNDKTHQPIPWK